MFRQFHTDTRLAFRPTLQMPQVLQPLPVKGWFTQLCHLWAKSLSVGLLSAGAVYIGIAHAAIPERAELVNQIVAVVNDDVVTQVELDIELENIKMQLRRQQTSLPPDEVLVKQILDKLIVQRIQLQHAELRHISVNDEALNTEINRIAQSNNMDINSLRRALKADGIEFADYRERLRKEIIIFRLQQRQVTSKVTVTEQEIDSFIKNQTIQGKDKSQYRLGHILIVVPEAATANEIQMAKNNALDALNEITQGQDFAQVAIARSGGQQALNGGDLGWRKLVELPTLFAELVPDMKIGDVSQPIRSPSGFHIIKLIEKRSDQQQHFVQQTKARHILIKPSNVLSPIEAKENIIDLKLRLNAGADFVELAKAYSDDKGSAVDGGDLGWVNPGVMVKPFEKAMNELEPGEISPPVRTQFGWHIIEVLDRRQYDNTDEFRRNKVQDILRRQKIEPALENWLRRIRDEAFVDLRV